MNAFVLFSVFRGYNIKEFRSLDISSLREFRTSIYVALAFLSPLTSPSSPLKKSAIFEKIENG